MSRYTYFVTLSYDRDLGFSRSNFENTVRNERAIWHGTKGLWVERILDSHYDFELWPHPWPWTWIFKANFFLIAVSQEWESRSTWNKSDMSRWDVIPSMWLWVMTLTLDFEGQILIKLYHSNKMVDWHGLKECESIGCWTQVVTLNFDLTHDLDLTWIYFFNSHILGMRRLVHLE